MSPGISPVCRAIEIRVALAAFAACSLFRTVRRRRQKKTSTIGAASRTKVRVFFRPLESSGSRKPDGQAGDGRGVRISEAV